MSDFPPSGLDWCDGQSGRPGTATPSGALIITPSTSYLEELESSPEVERGEQATVRHSYKCDYALGAMLIAAYGRGVILQDSGGNQTQVLSATLAKAKGDSAILTITSEGLNFDTPPDEFEVEEVELNLALSKHPRYRKVLTYNLDDDGDIDDIKLITGFQILLAIEQAILVPQITAQEDNITQINGSTIHDPEVIKLASELLAKRRRGEETWYLAGKQVSWSSYYHLPPEENPGGYTEDPVTYGGLPAYFWSDTGQAGGRNTFIALAAAVNPAIWGYGISWLRKGDRVQHQRTWFKKTRTWIGAPLGGGPSWTAAWDSDIYPDVKDIIGP